MLLRTTKTLVTTSCLCLLFSAAPMPALAQRAAWYSFDDGTAADVSGNGHDGVIFGTPELVPSAVRRGLSFDGENDQIVVPDDFALRLATLTLSLWVQTEQVPVRTQWLVGKEEEIDGYRLLLREGGAVEFQVRATGEPTVRVTSPFPIPVGVWTHVAVSYDARNLSMYIDGELAARKKAHDLTLISTGALTIGADTDVKGVSKYFRGALDEVVVFEAPQVQSVLCRNAQKLWHKGAHRCIGAFQDVTESLGLGDAQHGHFGICMLDINNDGWVDLYYANGEDNVLPPNPLPTGTCPDPKDPLQIHPGNFNVFHMNRGDGTFHTDSAPDMGIDDFWFAMRNVWGDYENDGQRDLFSHNFISSPLYHAIPGSDPLVFEDVSLSSEIITCLRKGTGASWVDVDNDGWLDMFVVEYNTFIPPEDNLQYLFMNAGDGTFTEVGLEAGFVNPDNPMGTTFADYDNDGDQDVFITNSPPVPTRLYRNDGVDPLTGIPHFTDVAVEAGVMMDDFPAKGIGASWGDYNNDGFLDLLFLREGGSRLFRNNGPTAAQDAEGTKSGDAVWTFTDVTGVGGLDLTGISCAGGNFADIDNDGFLDILAVGGFAGPGANRVFLNNGDGTWLEVASLLGMEFPQIQQFGVVPGDIDNDGDLDIAIASRRMGDTNYVFRNLTRGNNWVQFRLTGTTSNRDAVGARITVAAAIKPGGPAVMQIREVVAGTGFFSDIPRIQSFGLGKAQEILGATVRWPSGMVQDLGPVDVNMRHDVMEP